MLIEDYVKEISSVVPGLKIKEKSKSWLMRLLGKILFFNKGFMTDYYTTIGKTIYTPTCYTGEADSMHVISIFAHEAQHVYDRSRMYGTYALLYLFPQSLALFGLMGLLGFWLGPSYYASFGMLFFLAPFPAPFRTEIERRGYLLTLSCLYWIYGNNVDSDFKEIAARFQSMDYYRMWPDKDTVERWLRTDMKAVRENKFPNELYSKTKDFIMRKKSPKGKTETNAANVIATSDDVKTEPGLQQLRRTADILPKDVDPSKEITKVW